MLNKVEDLIEDIRSGKMVILLDDESRENEGDLVLAADHVTSEKINFMAKEARGLICLSLTMGQVERLGIPLMVQEDYNLTSNKTAFTVSIEASEGVTTGISAADRCTTIQAATNPKATKADVRMPGHVFPIRAQRGGVLKRAGHTEASVDLAKLAGQNPSAVICEIMNEDGTMARTPELIEFAKKHDIKIGSIEDLIQYRLQHDTLVQEVASAKLPIEFGSDFKIHVFQSVIDGSEHIALVKGGIQGDEPVLVRVHSECLTGDVFGSLRCDCGSQLKNALGKIQVEGRGVLLYLRQEGRGIGLVNKIKAYKLQEQGMDTVDANIELGFKPDHRDYGIGAQILRYLGVSQMKLMTNNPAKRVGLKAYGLEVVERVPLEGEHGENNYDYMLTKINKMGHLIDLKDVLK